MRYLPLVALFTAAVLHASPQEAWNGAASLTAVPEVFPAEEFRASDARIRGVFFSSVPFQGKPTRVFGWLGVPELPEGERAPGIVLLHGGGGTAFESWVKLWLDRGYAAIAIDHSGSLPLPLAANPRPRNPDGGPPGGSAVFSQLGEPLGDQWPFHAVAAASRALSLLRAEPGVDPGRIGVTGISWGGYLTCLFAGVDERLRFAIPVYGCGFYDDTVFGGTVEKLPPGQSALWWRQWDASLYLSAVRMPMLWVNGTNDHFFWMPAWQRSYRSVDPALRTLSLQVAMPHGHPPAGDPPEVLAFAESVVRGGPELPKVLHAERRGDEVHVAYQAPGPLVRADLHHSAGAAGSWESRPWKSIPATVGEEWVTARLPAGPAFYFLNLVDEHGRKVSTEHQFIPPPVSASKPDP